MSDTASAPTSQEQEQEKESTPVPPLVFDDDDYIASWGLDPTVAVYRSQSPMFDVRYLSMVEEIDPVINDDLVFQVGTVLQRPEDDKSFEWSSHIDSEYWNRYYQFVHETEIQCESKRTDRWDEMIEYVYPVHPGNNSQLIVRVDTPSDPDSFDVIQTRLDRNTQFMYFPLHGQFVKFAPYHEMKFLKYEDVAEKYQQIRFIRQRQFTVDALQGIKIIYVFKIVWVAACPNDIMSGDVQPHLEFSMIARPKWNQEFDRTLLLLSCLESLMDMQGRFHEATSFVASSANLGLLTDAVKAHLIPS